MALPWRSIWITGASSGIGEALARRLSGRGSAIAISARSEGRLAEIAAEAELIGAFPLDVTDAGATRGVVSAIEAAQGPIDLAVLNAGSWAPGGFLDLSEEELRLGVEVNYLGVLNGLRAVLPGMVARGAGRVAIVASVAGYRGLPNSTSYGPTKAALINLAEALRAELDGTGVAVSLVNPGFVDTPMTQKNDFEMPGLMAVNDAAEAFEKGLLAERFEISFPWRFTLTMKLLRILPHWLFFWLAKRLA